jgi:hypothetical protein
MWNTKTPIFEIPDEILKEILADNGEFHSYSINAEKGCFTIQKVPNHGGARECFIIYSSGKIVHIPKDKFKRDANG